MDFNQVQVQVQVQYRYVQVSDKKCIMVLLLKVIKSNFDNCSDYMSPAVSKVNNIFYFLYLYM